MHPNICTYCKSLLENLIDCNSDQLILMNCCDSMRRLYDVLKSKSSIKYLYMMDLPHKTIVVHVFYLKNPLLNL